MDLSSSSQGQTQEPTAPPVAPRSATPVVRRRAWADPRVRFWWIAAAALFVIAAYFFVSRYLNWREDARLIQSGVPIEATILQADQADLKGKTEPGDSPVRLHYEYNGQTYEPEAPFLEGRRSNQYLVVGTTVPIRIDADHPARWTSRTRPTPLSHELIGGTIALNIGILLLLASVWIRSGVLRTWRDGQATPALVMAARHTALVPRGWAVQCTLADASDKRLFLVFAPSKTDVSEGVTIWLLFPPGGGRPLAAAWFQ